MTIVNSSVPHTDSPSLHLKRAAVIVVCGLVFFLAMLPSYFINNTGFTLDHWSQQIQNTTLQVDGDCSPFGSLLSCVEANTVQGK